MGALTSKPYAFLARSWELEKVISVDFFDAFCSSVVVEVRGLEIMRVLPFLNDDLNSDWITNKIRFFYDGLKYQRLVTPFLMRRSKYGRRKGLLALDWRRALRFLYYFFRYKNFGASGLGASFLLFGILGEFNDLALQLVFRDFLVKLGAGLSDVFISSVGGSLGVDFFDYTASYYLLKNEVDICLVLSVDLRFEVPNLYSLFRRKLLQGRLKLYGFRSLILSSLSLKMNELPFSMLFFRKFVEGRVFFSQFFLSMRGCIAVLVGSSLFNRSDDFFNVLRKWSFLVRKLITQMGVRNALFNLVVYSVFEKSSLYTAMWLGFGGYGFKRGSVFNMGIFNLRRNMKALKRIFFSIEKKDKIRRWAFFNSAFFSCFLLFKVLFNLSADNLTFSKGLKYDFLLYQGFHGERGALLADMVLPQHAPTEADNYFVNLFGHIQMSRFVFAPPGLGRDGSRALGVLYQFLSRWSVKNSDCSVFMKFSCRLYSILGFKIALDFHVYSVDFFCDSFGFVDAPMCVYNNIGELLQYDFYRTDSLSRFSKFLALASKVNKSNFGFNSYLCGL